jgi:hypothetical protein
MPGLVRGSKYASPCLICGGADTFAFGRWPDGCNWITCHRCKALGLSGGAFLTEYAECVGAPNGATLLAFPLDYLTVENGHAHPSNRVPADLPSPASLAGWQSRLLSEHAALEYLLNERGLTERTVRREGLGFDSDKNAIVLPVYVDGELVNVRKRYLRPGRQPKIKGEFGHGSQLYPRPPSRKARSVIICAGEFDALVTAQNTGIETVTSTAGAGHWNAAWDVHFRHKHVAVIFDADEYAAAEKLAAALSCHAWPVQLELPGKQDLSDYWQHGGTREELIELITEQEAT